MELKLPVYAPAPLPEYGPTLVVHAFILVPATLDVDAPENALQEFSLVGEKYDDTDAVNVSLPLVKVKSDMNGDGGKMVPELPM